MNILYLAFACNPYTGSEAQCGWSWVIGMRRFAQVSVVTRSENKKNIQRYLQENNVTDLDVYYCDVPVALNIYYKTNKAYHLYYLMWQQVAARLVKKLHQEYFFDVIHHVTLGDFRYLGPHWKLGAKVVFGPVGGAQTTPAVFLPYVKEEQRSEKSRELINTLVGRMPFYRSAINHSALILAANQETQLFLKKQMKYPEKCELLTENGVQSEKLTGYRVKSQTDEVILLWSGRMVTRKGLSFLLDALKLISKETAYRLVLVGDGPEFKTLQHKAERLSLVDKIDFVGKVNYETMQEYYQKADIFVFPSLRETTGTVLFEAMSNGLPIISFNQNGAQLLIDKECGKLIDITDDLSQLVKNFADAIIELILDASKRQKRGKCAYEKIESYYVWERKCEMFYERYKELLKEEKNG